MAAFSFFPSLDSSSSFSVLNYEEPEDDALSSPPKHQQQQCVIARSDSSWNKSHQQTCQFLNSLMATPKQVLEQQSHNSSSVHERPTVEEVEVWGDDHAMQAASKRLMEQIEETSSNKNRSVPTTTVSWLYRTLMRKAAITIATTESEDDQDWLQQDDEYNAEVRRSALVEWHVQVLCMQLTVEACREIIRGISAPRSFYREGEHEDTCFFGWCRRDSNLIASKLPMEQLVFLAQVLELSKLATVKDEYIVLHKKQPFDNQIETCLASFQIKQAISAIETNLINWTANIQRCEQNALAMKRANKPTAQLLSEWKKKKLMEQQVESAHSSLLNLELLQAALESAKNQMEIIKVLQVSRETWTSINVVTLEEVDNVVSDLKDEFDLSTQLNATLDITTSTIVYNEEDLLEELEGLTISESVQIVQSQVINSTGFSKVKPKMAKKMHQTKAQMEELSSLPKTAIAKPIPMM